MEIWKTILDYDGRYEISNLGRVRYLKQHIKFQAIASGHRYKEVRIKYKGVKHLLKVHRLVAIYFIANPNNLETVDHINGDKLDNRECNLQWLSAVDNWKKDNSGKDHWKCKLTHEDVRIIKKLHKEGHAQVFIGNRIGIDCSVISRVLSGKHFLTKS